MVHVGRSGLVAWRNVLIHPSIQRDLRRLLEGHDDVRLTSGWRSPGDNRRVGGVDRSRHLSGVAVDIAGPRSTLVHLAEKARRYGAVEVLQESDHLHVGWRRPGP